MKKKLIIIGAGATGLMAGSLLQNFYSVEILESDAAAGGRILTLNGNECGAEFIHGKLPLTFSLLHEAGVAVIPFEGKMYEKKITGLQESEADNADWKTMLKKMENESTDVSLQNFLDKNFSEKDEVVRKAISYAKGFNLASPEKVSMKALWYEWSNEAEDLYRPEGGYIELINLLVKKCEGCNLFFNSRVTTIRHSEKNVQVITDDGRFFSADKILITVPVIVLQLPPAAGIHFDPEIPVQRQAATNIGFGNVIKVILHFSEACWPDDAGFIFSDERIPTWWTHLPGQPGTITGWCGGPDADVLSEKPDDHILQVALESLSGIFNIPVSTLQTFIYASYVYNWKNKTNICGGYHYSTLQTRQAQQLLLTPINDVLFFAGEALYEGKSPATVEAALASGKQAAELLLEIK